MRLKTAEDPVVLYRRAPYHHRAELFDLPVHLWAPTSLPRRADGYVDGEEPTSSRNELVHGAGCNCCLNPDMFKSPSVRHR